MDEPHTIDELLGETRVFASSEGNVWKYVYQPSDAITEAVLYKYPSFDERTVLCCSVQSGCPVGCGFCGTGNNFLRNLTAEEIAAQPTYAFNDKGIDTDQVKKLQIMFMSMGEPFLNYPNVEGAIRSLNEQYPNAQLLISTIAPRAPKHLASFIDLSRDIDQLGLQFSIHKSTNEERDKLIPFKGKLSLEEIRDYGVQWWHESGRNPFCNYCIDGTNSTPEDFDNLRKLFPPNVFHFTFSVVCSPDETMRDAGYRNYETINQFRQRFIEAGYDTRVFDPAGQDDIGGGCGQLWYVQRFLQK